MDSDKELWPQMNVWVYVSSEQACQFIKFYLFLFFYIPIYYLVDVFIQCFHSVIINTPFILTIVLICNLYKFYLPFITFDYFILDIFLCTVIYFN